jgi:hypothetical protein
VIVPATAAASAERRSNERCVRIDLTAPSPPSDPPRSWTHL